MSAEEIMLRLDRDLPLLIHKVVHRTKTCGVGPAAMMTLRKLRQAESCTVSELAEWMGVTSATVTGITNKLAAQNLIERVRDSLDRRVVHIRLTDAGESVLLEIERIRRDGLAKLLSNLTTEDQTKLVELIEKLIGSSQE